MHLIGGLLTVIAFFLIGTASAKEIRSELRALESLLAFLRELSRRLLWSRATLQTMFSTYREPFLESAGFLPAIRQADPKQVPAVWIEALSCLPLSEESLRVLEELGQSLGRVSLETQKEQLALCIAALEETYTETKAKAKEKQRSAVALWTLAGLLVALLFL